jgi:hypothetical protein
MRTPVLTLLTALLLLLPMRSLIAQQQRTPVLVELFTSEGCSSCPPADALLAKLTEQPIAGAEVIALGEHVDYWNNSKWHDRFSSRQLTDRQVEYGRRFHLETVYTPQMVVDGRTQLIGSNATSAVQAITQSAQHSKLPLQITDATWQGNTLTARLTLAATKAKLPHADLYVALIDRKDSSDVRGGENSGRLLVNVAVVRALRRVGPLQQLGKGPLTVHLALPTAAARQNLQLVAFAQRPGLGEVVAVAIR